MEKTSVSILPIPGLQSALNHDEMIDEVVMAIDGVVMTIDEVVMIVGMTDEEVDSVVMVAEEVDEMTEGGKGRGVETDGDDTS